VGIAAPLWNVLLLQVPPTTELIYAPGNGRFPAYIKVIAMAKLAKSLGAVVVLTLATYLPATQPASAITAELAKKCRALAIKAHPTPTPGSKKTGIEKAQRDYFRECVAKDGKTEN